MKKLLLGSVFLTIFALSITIFQISCQKEAVANPDLNSISETTPLNKIFFLIRMNKMDFTEIWIANYDGSDKKKINIALPSGYTVLDFSLSPDHQNLFVSARNPLVNGGGNIYSCKIDGSNLIKIFDGTDLDIEGLKHVVAY